MFVFVNERGAGGGGGRKENMVDYSCHDVWHSMINSFFFPEHQKLNSPILLVELSF